jgi:hypothetical protein
LYYHIVREDLKGMRLHIYRIAPRTLSIPKGEARYLIAGIEHHNSREERLRTDAQLFEYARGRSTKPPACITTSCWQIMLVFRKARSSGGKRQYCLMSYVVENCGVFSLLEKDEYVYIDGEFDNEHEAERHRVRIIHEGVREYLRFDGRSVSDFLPQQRSEFAALAKKSS